MTVKSRTSLPMDVHVSGYDSRNESFFNKIGSGGGAGGRGGMDGANGITPDRMLTGLRWTKRETRRRWEGVFTHS